MVSTRRSPKVSTAALIDFGAWAKPNKGEPATRRHCAAMALSYDTRRTTSSNATSCAELPSSFIKGRNTAGMAGMVSMRCTRSRIVGVKDVIIICHC